MIVQIKAALFSLRNKLVNMIQRTFASRTTPYIPGEYPIVQVSNTPKRNFTNPTFNKTTSLELLNPYGFISRPPEGAIGVKFNIQGESSNQAGILYDPTTLPAHDVNETVVGAFSAPVLTYLKFTNAGTIEVWKGETLVIADLITHIHSGVTTGGGVSGPPVI